jgi:hypothetical protein
MEYERAYRESHRNRSLNVTRAVAIVYLAPVQSIWKNRWSSMSLRMVMGPQHAPNREFEPRVQSFCRANPERLMEYPNHNEAPRLLDSLWPGREKRMVNSGCGNALYRIGRLRGAGLHSRLNEGGMLQ